MERSTWNMRQCRAAMTLEMWEAVKPRFLFFFPLTNIDAGLLAYLENATLRKRPDSNAFNMTCIRINCGTPEPHVNELSASRRQVSWTAMRDVFGCKQPINKPWRRVTIKLAPLVCELSLHSGRRCDQLMKKKKNRSQLRSSSSFFLVFFFFFSPHFEFLFWRFIKEPGC